MTNNTTYTLTTEQARLVFPTFQPEMVERSFTENTGGGCMVDFYILENGQCISLTDDAICLWSCYDDFYAEGCEDFVLASEWI